MLNSLCEMTGIVAAKHNLVGGSKFADYKNVDD